MECSPPGSSVHGISQARILEWVAISSSRGSSRPRDQTCVSCMGRQILYHWASSEVQVLFYWWKKKELRSSDLPKVTQFVRRVSCKRNPWMGLWKPLIFLKVIPFRPRWYKEVMITAVLIYSDFLPKGILDLRKTLVNGSLSSSSDHSANQV